MNPRTVKKKVRTKMNPLLKNFKLSVEPTGECAKQWRRSSLKSMKPQARLSGFGSAVRILKRPYKELMRLRRSSSTEQNPKGRAGFAWRRHKYFKLRATTSFIINA